MKHLKISALILLFSPFVLCLGCRKPKPLDFNHMGLDSIQTSDTIFKFSTKNERDHWWLDGDTVNYNRGSFTNTIWSRAVMQSDAKIVFEFGAQKPDTAVHGMQARARLSGVYLPAYNVNDKTIITLNFDLVEPGRAGLPFFPRLKFHDIDISLWNMYPSLQQNDLSTGTASKVQFIYNDNTLRMITPSDTTQIFFTASTMSNELFLELVLGGVATNGGSNSVLRNIEVLVINNP